jgi:hypothetical protein
MGEDSQTKQIGRKQTPKHRGLGTALTPYARGGVHFCKRKKGKQNNPYHLHNSMHCQVTERMKKRETV